MARRVLCDYTLPFTYEWVWSKRALERHIFSLILENKAEFQKKWQIKATFVSL